MKPDYNTNHVMLTPKIKTSESAVALKRISQLRRPGIANSTPCKAKAYKKINNLYVKHTSKTERALRKGVCTLRNSL